LNDSAMIAALAEFTITKDRRTRRVHPAFKS
jgi:hypothetical protein